MLITPTLDGNAIFGSAVRIRVMPAPVSYQYDAFCGVDGLLALYLGSRGRTFEISGVFVDTDPLALCADISNLATYADGAARTLVDTMGGTWPNVIFDGAIREDPQGPHPTTGGNWCISYSTTFRGLS